jgi:UDP-2,4-diacetamido-2,4,6-trideoxy-beta-L-altropyranose hydrolase
MDLLLRKVITDPNSPQFRREALFILSVRNDPETRAMSLTTHVVPWETHWTWYVQSAQNPKRHLYILQQGPDEIGIVRLDENEESATRAEIHIALRPEFRGRGLGRAALTAACEEARRLGYTFLVARVKRINSQSLRLFEKAGFSRQPGEQPSQDAVSLVTNITGDRPDVGTSGRD